MVQITDKTTDINFSNFPSSRSEKDKRISTDSCNNSHDTLRTRVPCSRRKAIIYTAFIFIKINAKQWTRGGADSGQPRDLHEDMYTRSNKWNGKKMEKQEGDGKR